MSRLPSTFADASAVMKNPLPWHIGSAALASLCFGANSCLFVSSVGHLWWSPYESRKKGRILAIYATILYFVFVTPHWVMSCAQAASLLVSLIHELHAENPSTAEYSIPIHFTVHVLYGSVSFYTHGLWVGAINHAEMILA
jgi:hypothetical protein